MKVDLRKAQTACSDLTDQLTKSETNATNFKEQLTSVSQELNDAREAKDQALKELRDTILRLTIEKEAAWRVAESVFRGAASIARELGAKQAQEEASREAKHPPKAPAALPTMAPQQVWSLISFGTLSFSYIEPGCNDVDKLVSHPKQLASDGRNFSKFFS